MLIAFLVLTISELIYFRIAQYFDIVDKPNIRSSHSQIVLRGGGVIFIIAIIYFYLVSGFTYSYFVFGAILVAVISFLDDILPQRAWLRFLVQFIGITLLFYQVDLFSWNVGLAIAALIVCIGALNAFNFMDGINGITGIYALVNLITFLYINVVITDFTATVLLEYSLISVFVFLFFNFRKSAKCFAGDVGSVSIAFIQVFFLLELIVATNNLYWVLVVFVFGIDSVFTIVHRLIRRENIFTAHRSHLYQFLANEFKWDHRLIALIYGAIQLVLNVLMVKLILDGQFSVLIILACAIAVAYLLARYIIVRRMALSSNFQN